jgi:hypothetical protein
MLALRFAGLLALAVWVGGLAALGAIAAPAIFDAVTFRQIADGRALSGAIFGEILRRFHLVAYACAAAVIGSLIIRAVLGPRPRWFAVRVAIAAVMLAATAYSGLIVSPRIERLRTDIGVSPSSLAESDPRRAAFGQLHGLSTALQFVPLMGGLLLLQFEARE